MNLAIKNTHAHENALIWAVIASLLLHVLLAWVLPNFNFDVIKPNKVLVIELQKPVPPEPVKLEQIKPEPPKPEPVKETVKPTIKPIVKPIETPSPMKQEAAPLPPAVDKVIAVQPTAESKPAIIAPLETPKPAETPKQVEAAPANIDNALDEYGSTLGRAIAKHKQYPRIAQMRGWQGDVLLDLKIDGSGNVLSAKVRESTGHEALDNQALEMVRKASPFPAPPEALRIRTFNITVPVSFKLENA